MRYLTILIFMFLFSCNQYNVDAGNDNKIFDSLYFITAVNNVTNITNLNSTTPSAGVSNVSAGNFKTITGISRTSYTYSERLCGSGFRIVTEMELKSFLNLMSKNSASMTDYELSLYKGFDSYRSDSDLLWVSDFSGDTSTAWVFSIYKSEKDSVFNKSVLVANPVCYRR